MDKSNFKYIKVVLLVVILVVCIIGATYAYFLSTTIGSSDINASSVNYSVNMNITPIYNDFSLIPMDDSDVFKAIGNQCKDKEDRGACNLYGISVSGYDESVEAISGTINTSLNNIQNLSYMVLEKVSYNIEGNSNCLVFNENNYCISKEATLVVTDTDMSLGDSSYDVSLLDSKDLLLAIWLTNIDSSQNSFDIGTYSSIVTIYLGDDIAHISGSISGTLKDNYTLQGGE